MQPKSNTLFHFTKNRDVLKQILKSGFWPRYCLEDVGWLGYEQHDYTAFPMVCFCEIPLSRIADHVAFYGEFGLGLTREWAETNGLNPVLYVAGANQLAKAFRQSIKHAGTLPEGEQRDAAFRESRYLLAHAKPTSGKTLVDGEPVEKVFYQESEWRYVPRSVKFRDYMNRTQLEKDGAAQEQNELVRQHALLKFSPRDVRYIFVKSDADIPDVINFINSELDQYTGSDQKILMSRVLSLESLHGDL